MANNTTNEKYNLILQSAIEVITEKGYEKTSISDIVKRAKIAQGTFYLYFKSKKDLIPAIASNLLSITFGNIKSKAKYKDNFWDILKIIIDETFDLTDIYKDIIILCYQGLAIEKSLEKWEEIYAPYYNWLESMLKSSIEVNEINGELTVERMSRLIISSVESDAERYYISLEQEESVEKYKNDIFYFLKRSLE